jgi:hypothetical protein
MIKTPAIRTAMGGSCVATLAISVINMALCPPTSGTAAA